MENQFKQSTTLKPYEVKKYHGYSFTVPEGWPVNNQTACGFDDAYRFAAHVGKLAILATGVPESLLRHDLTYYGLNIPADYCHPY